MLLLDILFIFYYSVVITGLTYHLLTIYGAPDLEVIVNLSVDAQLGLRFG